MKNKNVGFIFLVLFVAFVILFSILNNYRMSPCLTKIVAVESFGGSHLVSILEGSFNDETYGLYNVTIYYPAVNSGVSQLPERSGAPYSAIVFAHGWLASKEVYTWIGNSCAAHGYYDTPLGNSANGGPYVCVDLRTGETIWQRDDISPTFAQLYLYESMNQHGVIGDGYLWQVSGNKWDAYDPRTGQWLFALTNVPTGTNVYTENGAITRYVINCTARWLALWTTEALPNSPLVATPGTTSYAYQYRPIGKQADMSKNYLWNVTIPNLPVDSTIYAAIPDDILFGGTPLQPPGVFFWIGN
jgi:hypothetical protein